jgi:multidrug efflux pump subunit AcrA (membrane-fusion protein)
MSRKRWAILLAAGLSPFSGWGCSHGGPSAESKAEAVPAEPRAVPVTVADLVRQPVERTVPIEGTLRAWEDVVVSAKRGGEVLKVERDMGDRVKPGDTLVTLDPTDAQLAVMQAEARFLSELVKLGITREQAAASYEKYGLTEKLYTGEEAERLINELPLIVQGRATVAKIRLEYQRQQNLYNKGVGTLMDLQNAENDYKVAEATLDNGILTAKTTIANSLAAFVAHRQAERDLEEMTITVPEPATPPEGMTRPGEVGYAIKSRSVSEGQRLKDGEQVFELVIEDPIRLWANVPERYSPQIELGQAVRLKAMARPGETFEGKVARINPAVDPISRTFKVEAVVPNPDGLLRPGGFAKGEIVVEREDEAVVVPIESVNRFAGVTKIFVLDGEKARSIPVETGRQVGRLVEVVGEGLPASGRVVTTGMSKLAEGTRVIIRPRGAEPVGPEPEAGPHGGAEAPPVEAGAPATGAG